jgi:hypothetical protein
MNSQDQEEKMIQDLEITMVRDHLIGHAKFWIIVGCVLIWLYCMTQMSGMIQHMVNAWYGL